MVAPTTVDQAEAIVDRISDTLIKQDYVGGIFVPFSKTGASSRLQIAHATMLAIANLYRRVFSHKPSPQELKVWEDFSKGAGGTIVSVMYQYFPDVELATLRKTYTKEKRFSREVMAEESRLQSLAETDSEIRRSENIDSYISFLQTLDLSSSNYWQLVYARLGLPCPVQHRDGT
jgi:hypothetical protein